MWMNQVIEDFLEYRNLLKSIQLTATDHKGLAEIPSLVDKSHFMKVLFEIEPEQMGPFREHYESPSNNYLVSMENTDLERCLEWFREGFQAANHLKKHQCLWFYGFLAKISVPLPERPSADLVAATLSLNKLAEFNEETKVWASVLNTIVINLFI